MLAQGTRICRQFCGDDRIWPHSTDFAGLVGSYKPCWGRPLWVQLPLSCSNRGKRAWFAFHAQLLPQAFGGVKIMGDYETMGAARARSVFASQSTRPNTPRKYVHGSNNPGS